MKQVDNDVLKKMQREKMFKIPVLIFGIALVGGCMSSPQPLRQYSGAEHSGQVVNGILQCEPGCKLDSNSDGEPIIPVWCEEWGQVQDVYCEVSAEDPHCFNGSLGPNYPLRAPEESDAIQPDNNQSVYCKKIRLNNLSGDQHAPYRADQYARLNIETIACRPGCIYSDFSSAEEWCGTLQPEVYRNVTVGGAVESVVRSNQYGLCSMVGADKISNLDMLRETQTPPIEDER